MFGWFKKKEEQILQKLPAYKNYECAFEVGSSGIVVSFHKNGNFDDISMNTLQPPKREPDLIENLSIGFLKDGKCIRRNEYFLKEGIAVLIDEEQLARDMTNNPSIAKRDFHRMGLIGQCPLTKMLMVFWQDNNCWTFLNKRMCDAYNSYVADSHLLEDVGQRIVNNGDSEEW